MNLIFSVKCRTLPRQTPSERAKRFLGPFFPVSKKRFDCCLIAWGEGVKFCRKLTSKLAKNTLKVMKGWWLKKIGPRNPLAIVDDVCLYNYLQLTEKMKSIISGGYFGDAI